MNDKELFEKAAARAEQINKVCKDYELARASLEALKQDGIILHTTVEAVDKFEDDKFELTPLPSDTEKLIINMFREIYEQRIEECKRIVNGYVPGPYTQASISTLAETYMNAMNRKMQEVREEVKTEEPITAEDDPTKLVPILRMNGRKVKSIEAVRDYFKDGDREYMKEVAEIVYDSGLHQYADIGCDSNLTACFDVLGAIQEIKPRSKKIERIERGIYEMPKGGKNDRSKT